MNSKQINFFSTSDDLRLILDSAFRKFDFSIVKIEEIEAPRLNSLVSDIPDFGIAKKGDCNFEDAYLLVEPSVVPLVRRIETRSGGVRYLLDQNVNPKSVFFRPGGIFLNEDVIVSGQVGTISSDIWSLNLFDVLKEEFKRNSKNIKSNFVTKTAEALMDSGFRLTSSIHTSREYDLKK